MVEHCYAECHYVECRYAKCRVADILAALFDIYFCQP
jgi:hypothetical protein